MKSLRIALCHPTYWPEVRRGSERLVHDLATALRARGHTVTILTSHPAATTRTVEDGIEVIRARRPREPERMSFYEHYLLNVPSVAARLLTGGYDLAQAFFVSDAWAAVQARRLGGPPVVFSYHGVPAREGLIAHRGRIELLKATVARAAATTVLSEAAADAFRRYLLVRPRVLGGGVIAADFADAGGRGPEPTLFCAASLGDRRKRGELLFEAFAALRRRAPQVRLEIARPRDPFFSEWEVELPVGAAWTEGDRTPDLARAYANAHASVLPAVHEAFGLVVVESLAAGTPVVAARSGACPEILDDERIGVLFEPDDPVALEVALERGLELGQRPETSAACRERAADFDWSVVVRRYEELYEEVLSS